jgi:hypothetical protein
MGAATPAATEWIIGLERDAPDTVAVWKVLDDTGAGLIAARRELRRRVLPGSAARVLAEQEAIADALAAVLGSMPEPALRAPGGEEDWNVAQTFAHTTAARRFLAAWAAMAASGAWPSQDPPRVTPGIPGPADASREDLLTLLGKSRASMARSASQIADHETQPCPLEHPLVGHLRCGGWLMWTGVHDLMHLEQLQRIAASFPSTPRR